MLNNEIFVRNYFKQGITLKTSNKTIRIGFNNFNLLICVVITWIMLVASIRLEQQNNVMFVISLIQLRLLKI